MTTLSLARPIENIDASHEAKVLAIIAHLMPALSEWRRGEDLRDELSRVEDEIEKKQVLLRVSKDALAAARVQHGAAKPVDFEQTHFMIMGGGAIVGVIFAAMGYVVVGLIVALVLAGGGAGVAFANTAKKNGETEAAISRHDTEAQKLAAVLADLTSKRVSLSAQIANRAAGFPDVKVADVRFGLSCAQIAGHNVLLDTSSTHDDVTLKAVDVSELKADLSKISERVQTLLAVPPLLTPDESAATQDPVHALFGEEEQLQDLVGEFTVNLGKVKDVVLRIPLVPARSLLAERLASGVMDVSAGDAAIEMAGLSGVDERIAKFDEQVSATRDSGPRTFAELTEVFENLVTVCNLYANARVTSINTIHANVIDVLNRAAWCNRRFYCPRTIQAPKYVQELLGVDPERAYLLAYDDLIQRLKGDPEIAKRLNAKPEIDRQLHEAYYAVHDFTEGMVFDESGNRADNGSRPRHIEEQFQEAVKRFTNLMQTAMTGAAYPVLNFSSEAQLYYDPEAEEWTSNTSPYTYNTAETVKYGSVVKAYSDLMVPLWEHLWTEKTDFRKSELFRTNESMIRMSEKESEKLINIADQFRADMRTVRENIHVIESDLKSKYSEITSFRDSMERLELLSPRAKEAITDEKLQHILLGDLKVFSTDRYETSLSAIPQAQAQNRGTVYDPIDIVREPNAIVTCRPSTGPRLLPDSRVDARE
jgi:hypothetical protein